MLWHVTMSIIRYIICVVYYVFAYMQGTKQALATRKMRVWKAPVEYPSQYTRP